MDRTKLQKELATTLAKISALQAGASETAATAASLATLMSKSWTIRYSLLSLDHDACGDALDQLEYIQSMERASKQAELWTKRQLAARKAIADDDTIDAVEHERTQSELADSFLKLVKS